MFELIRQFRTYIFFGAAILCAFAFGITGVVIQVFAPRESPRTKPMGHYTLEKADGTKKEVQVQTGEFQQFRRRWEQFLLNHLQISPLFSRRAMLPGRREGAVRRVLMTSMRRSRFLQKILQLQTIAGVDFIQGFLLYENPPSLTSRNPVSLLPELDRSLLQGGESQRKQILRQRWQKESLWRLHYFINIAREWGFRTTNKELGDLIGPLLQNRRGETIEYKTLVEQWAGMNVDGFEKTMREFLSLLKFLHAAGNVSTADLSDVVENYRSERGYGKLLYATMDAASLERAFRTSWKRRLSRRAVSLYPHQETVSQFSSFRQDITGTEGSRRNSNSSKSMRNVLEKRQFGYLFVPYEPYLDDVDDPTEDELRSYYEDNREEFSVENGSRKQKDNSSSNDNEEDNEENYRPFQDVKASIREKLLRKRAIRKADTALQEFRESTITDMETAGEPVKFPDLAEKHGSEEFPLRYRESPLLDLDGFKFWLRSRKGMDIDTYWDTFKKYVFDRSPEEGGKPGPYPEANETLYIENGVMFPRVLRVEDEHVRPGTLTETRSNGAVASMGLESFKKSNPVWSLELRKNLETRSLNQQARNKVNEKVDELKDKYRSRRDKHWTEIELFGPPVPAWVPENSTPSEGENEKGAASNGGTQFGPPAVFADGHVEDSLVYKRARWKAAKKTFKSFVEEQNMEMGQTALFDFESGPDDENVLEGLSRKVTSGGRRRFRRRRGSNVPDQFDVFSVTEDDKIQMGTVIVKLPPNPDNFDEYLSSKREELLGSAQSSGIQDVVASYVEKANLRLEQSPPGTKEEEESSSDESSQ